MEPNQTRLSTFTIKEFQIVAPWGVLRIRDSHSSTNKRSKSATNFILSQRESRYRWPSSANLSLRPKWKLKSCRTCKYSWGLCSDSPWQTSTTSSSSWAVAGCQSTWWAVKYLPSESATASGNLTRSSPRWISVDAATVVASWAKNYSSSAATIATTIGSTLSHSSRSMKISERVKWAKTSGMISFSARRCFLCASSRS